MKKFIFSEFMVGIFKNVSMENSLNRLHNIYFFHWNRLSRFRVESLFYFSIPFHNSYKNPFSRLIFGGIPLLRGDQFESNMARRNCHPPPPGHFLIFKVDCRIIRSRLKVAILVYKLEGELYFGLGFILYFDGLILVPPYGTSKGVAKGFGH